jgi:hypothetical protein
VVGSGVDGDRPQSGVVAGTPGGERRRLRAERVGAQVAGHRGRIDAALGDQREQRLGGRRVDHDSGHVEQDAVEGVGQRGRRDPVEPDRGDAVVQVGEDRLVGGLGVRVGVPLAHVPAGAGGRGAAGERRRTGCAGAGDRGGGGVERRDRDPVVRGDREQVVDRLGGGVLAGRAGPTQDAEGQVPPLGCGGGGEIGGEPEFLGRWRRGHDRMLSGRSRRILDRPRSVTTFMARLVSGR